MPAFLALLVGCQAVVPGLVPAPPPAPATLTVTAWPDDAQIRVGDATGEGRVTVEVPPGEVSIGVVRDGFVEHRGSVEVGSGEVRDVSVRLEGAPLEVRFAVWPPGATVASADGTVLGTAPLGVTVPAGDHVWVVSADGWAPETIAAFVDRPLTLERWLDAPGQRVDRVRMIDTCHLPKQVLVHPHRDEVWVSCLGGPPSVVAHDLTTGAEVASLTLGEAGAVELHLDADGSRLFASQMESALVYEIDIAARAHTRTFDTGSRWSKVVELAADGSRIYVSNWLGDDVSEIELGGGTLVRRIPTVGTPRGLYATRDGRHLYVAGFDAGELARIDLATGRSAVVWAGGSNLRHIVGDEDRGVLYLSDMGRRAILVHDLTTGGTTRLASTAPNPNTIDLSADGEVLFVSNRGRNGPGGYLTVGEPGVVLAIDTRTGAVLDTIAAGNQPTALDVEGDVLVFSDFRDDRLQVFRIPPTDVLRTPDPTEGTPPRPAPR